MPVQFLHFRRGAALFDPDEVSADALTELLSHGLDASSTPLPGAAGRAGVRVIQQARHQWVWRHNRRGGWPGRLIRDSYVWLGAARTRSFREWRLLQHLRRLGLPVPPPVAAVYERHGLLYRSDLITGLLAGTESFGSRLHAGPVPLSVWSRIGACIRQFHAHGIDHADLNVHNILLDEADQVHLIDFDRGAIRAPGAWSESNWSRLRRSLEKCAAHLPPGRFETQHWLALRG